MLGQLKIRNTFGNETAVVFGAGIVPIQLLSPSPRTSCRSSVECSGRGRYKSEVGRSFPISGVI